jgi:acyl-CoA thioester hydrolase
MARSDFSFATRVRVRYSEVDPQQVVFNARYLDYADIGMTEYLRAARALPTWPDERPEFHVRKAEVEFIRPIFADEEIDICCRLSASGRTSVTNVIEIHGAGQDDLRAIVTLVAVHVDLADHRPRPLPAWYAAACLAAEA